MSRVRARWLLGVALALGCASACVPAEEGTSAGPDAGPTADGMAGDGRGPYDGSPGSGGSPVTDGSPAADDSRMDDGSPAADGSSAADGSPAADACTEQGCAPAPDATGSDATGPDAARPDACVPACEGRACGDDGCGATCGECALGVCTAAGQCAEGAAPRLLSFATSAPALTEGQSVTFSAVVADPDGLADVLGGRLTDDATGADYGAFAAAAGEGAYALTLSWADLHRVRAIDFASPDRRAFRATFFDVAGHEAQGRVEVELACGDDGACDGRCTDLDAPESCGACGHACGADETCVARHCEAEPPLAERTDAQCTNGLDDDADGAIDCLDNDCLLSPSCAAGPCVVESIGTRTGDRVAHGSTRNGRDEQAGSCGGLGGDEVGIRFIASLPGVYRFDTEGSAFDTVLYLRAWTCDGPELACDNDGGPNNSSRDSLPLAAGQSVVVFIDADVARGGDYELNVTYFGE